MSQLAVRVGAAGGWVQQAGRCSGRAALTAHASSERLLLLLLLLQPPTWTTNVGLSTFPMFIFMMYSAPVFTLSYTSWARVPKPSLNVSRPQARRVVA